MGIQNLGLGTQLFQGIRDIFNQPAPSNEAEQTRRLPPPISRIPEIAPGDQATPDPRNGPSDEVTLSRAALRALGVEGLSGDQLRSFLSTGTEAFDETAGGFVAFRENAITQLSRNRDEFQAQITDDQQRLDALRERKAEGGLSRFARSQLDSQIRAAASGIDDLNARIFSIDTRIERYQQELAAFGAGATTGAGAAAGSAPNTQLGSTLNGDL